jgi:outer membrane protein insertion porin family
VISSKTIGKRAGAVFLVGTILGAWPAVSMAQPAPVPPPTPTSPTAPTDDSAPADTLAPAPDTSGTPAPANSTAPAAAPPAAPAAPTQGVIHSIAVRGNERLEPATVISYSNLRPGEVYTAATVDQALKDLYATELFKDVVISGVETGDIVINIKENPVINRIVLDGNKRIKDDKILPEIQEKAREIFTPSKARADVDRIIELYKRQGRFAASVDPQIVNLSQNRVDLIFKINEGEKSKIRAINIIGNHAFSEDRLRKQMFSHESGGFLGFLSSNTGYDPDRLAADQQKLRAYYLTEGYADFRVVQALAELTPDRRDFVITYVIDEGPRYRFGSIKADSQLRDLPPSKVMQQVHLKQGEWFNAKAVEDTVTALNETAGNLGYAFADIEPAYDRDPKNHVMNLTFKVGETPRVYVESVDINGNTNTHDKVVRREFRLNEGDAFNAMKVKRSQDRIQSLGYFQDNIEIKQAEGSSPDRIVLSTNLEEKSTGQLQFQLGYSTYEKFLAQVSVEQSNFRGMGQDLSAGVSYSAYGKSIQLGFTEPYLFDKAISLNTQLFRTDYRSFNYLTNSTGGLDRNTTYSQLSTGGRISLGFPITEYLTLATRYGLSQSDITLDKTLYYTNGQCDPLKAGRYLCDEIGNLLTSAVGLSVLYSDVNGIHPTRGQVFSLSEDFAGLGGDVRYLRTIVNATKYHDLGGGWVLSAHAEGGYIKALQKSPGPGRDPVHLTDRFFIDDIRGFDIRGIGPRVIRIPYDSSGVLTNPSLTSQNIITDALGGDEYYHGRIELELPVGSAIKSMGIRPSVYVDAGSVWGLVRPQLTDIPGVCTVTTSTGSTSTTLNPGQTAANCPSGAAFTPGYKEEFFGNSPRPRLSIGVGFNWISPFGPLRLDFAKALMKQKGDDTKLFTFNVGSQF